jgi:hypothetical protein
MSISAVNVHTWVSAIATLIKMRQKFGKYTIVIWVQPKYTLTFPCIFVYVLFEPQITMVYLRNFLAPF